jgi:formamidopyrimidine-DNA glycosylase
LGASLTLKEAVTLRKELQKILRKAIQMRGSSISDFVDSEGIAGDYQQRHKVYGREGKKCFRCGARIKRMIVAGRSSHYCSACQRSPRGNSGAPKKVKRKRHMRASKR